MSKGGGNGTTSVQRRMLLAAAVSSIGLVCGTHARAGGDSPYADPVDLRVVDRETGQPLRMWRHDGRVFVAGEPGARYGLRVTNRTDARVLVVMSVDGVNILTGETAGYDQRGYIFGPHESYDLNGWRKSLSEVADFTFTRLSQSYAARTGRPQNVGVIGIAVFDERTEPVAAEPAEPPAATRAARPPPTPRLALREAPEPPPPEKTAGAKNGAGGMVSELVVAGQKREQREESVPVAVSVFTGRQRDVVGAKTVNDLADPGARQRAATAESRAERLGTGHGEREYSELTIEPFERATPYPQFKLEIAYDTYDNLVASGIIPTWRYGERRPRPFPSSPDGGGFVPDPPRDP